MRIYLNALAAGALALGLATSASAQNVTAGAIEIQQPWARATPPGAEVGGGYMSITNNGTEPDTLLGGASPVAEEVQVHEMSVEGDVMKMRQLAAGLEIKPGATVMLKPGGYHLMLVKLKKPLKQGEQVPATLDFAKAGKVAVMLNVESIGAKAPKDMSGTDNGMSGMDMGNDSSTMEQ